MNSIIFFGRDNLMEAKKIASSREYACKRAREIYEKDCAGMYQTLEKRARAVLEAADEFGFTEVDPLCIKEDGKIMCPYLDENGYTFISMAADYKKGATLLWGDLWESLGLKRDNGDRWYPSDDSPDFVHAYIDEGAYRSPSRAWPHSYAKPLLTQKFAKYLTKHAPKMAVELGIAELRS